MKPILVIGSTNTDMVIKVSDLPQPGQTILGNDFSIFAGGKGANQAVAARRAGANVRFLAAVGNDDFGRNALEGLSDEGIDTHSVCVLDGIASGVAMIFVSASGENCIGVAPGANGELTPEILRSNEDLFGDSDFVLIQLETPMQTVVAAVELAAANNTACILNPAPAAAIPDHAYAGLYCITPNQSEAELLTGVAVVDKDTAKRAAEVLLGRGVTNAVITMGEQGALLCNADGCFFAAAEKVTVVDTTGAGDTFNGAFTAMLANGKSLQDALVVAVSAATRSVQKAGAISSIPHLNDSDMNI